MKISLLQGFDELMPVNVSSLPGSNDWTESLAHAAQILCFPLACSEVFLCAHGVSLKVISKLELLLLLRCHCGIGTLFAFTLVTILLFLVGCPDFGFIPRLTFLSCWSVISLHSVSCS